MSTYQEIVGTLDATGMRLTIIVSRFNSFFTEQLLKGSVDCAVRHGATIEDIRVIRVPGANEIPLAATFAADATKTDAIVALGAVVDGATDHAMLINTTVAKALCEIGLKAGIPVVNGILCAHNLDQAIERSGTKAGNKGWDVTQAAIEAVAVVKQLKSTK